MAKTSVRVAFVGCGQTPLTKKPVKTETELAIEACVLAAQDAGMKPSDIDGIWTQVHHYPAPETAAIVKGIGMKEVRWQREGGLGIAPAGTAAQAIEAKDCNAVVIVKIMNSIAPIRTPRIDASSGGVGGRDQFEVPYGVGYARDWLALRARRHMHRWGLSREQMGWICITQRQSALLNPYAIMKKALTMEDYLAARTVVEPLHLFDLDHPVNGAYAFLLTRGDVAQTLRYPPVYLIAWATSNNSVPDHMLPEILDGMSPWAEELYRDAEIPPEEIDMWYMYDGFSYFVPLWMETLGLVPRGGAGEYVQDGTRIRIGGEHPLNTNGGALSEGRMHGHGHIIEAVQQLRGNAGPRQARSPNTAIVSTVFPELGGQAGILARA
jgi:acetyl-CoA acetyltransferase